METDLYAMKTNEGYGIFQRYEADFLCKGVPPFSVVYRTQIKSLKDLKSALKGDYYFAQLFQFNRLSDKIGTEVIYKDCAITYLGKYPQQSRIVMPQRARLLNSDSRISMQYEWAIMDLTGKAYFVDNHGEANTFKRPDGRLAYKKLVPEIVDYPIFGVVTFNDLLENFNINFHPRDYNDEYVIELTKKYRREITKEEKKEIKQEWKEVKKEEKEEMKLARKRKDTNK